MIEKDGLNAMDIANRFAQEITEHLGYDPPVTAVIDNNSNIAIVNQDVDPPVAGKTYEQISAAMCDWREANGLEAF